MNDSWIDATTCEARTFRNALGSFMTGVTVVSTRMPDGQARAFTANSFTSVSLDPPLVLVCLARTSSNLKIFEVAQNFSICVLGEGQRDTSNAFASRDPRVKEAAAAGLCGTEVPYVRDSLSALICERYRVVEAGDHIILIGLVRKLQTSDGQPLGFFRGSYVGIGPAVSELERLHSSLIVGGVLDVGGKVLLHRRIGNATWEIPSRHVPYGESHSSVLHSLFSGLGAHVDVTLLYSLFREQDEHSTTLIFSVEAATSLESRLLSDGSEVAFFGADEEPWKLITGEMKKGLLKRYFREKAAGSWGIYFDTADGGKVATLYGKPQPWSDETIASLSSVVQ